MPGRAFRDARDGEDAVPLEEHDNVGANRQKRRCPKTWKFAIGVLLVCALFLIGVVVGYCVAQLGLVRRLTPAGCENGDTTDDVPESQAVLDKGAADDYEDPRELEKRHWKLVEILRSMDYTASEDLMEFSNVAVHSGSRHDRDLMEVVHNQLVELSLDEVHVETYHVLLSVPDPLKQNLVRFFYSNDTNQTISLENLNGRSGHMNGFVPFSPSADVQGELIHLDFSSYADFAQASSANLAGKIALVRTGNESLEQMISVAASHKMLGMLVYEDLEGTSGGHKKCGSHAPHIVINNPLSGDLLTPGFPSIDGVMQLPENETVLPPLPIRTVSCQLARSLIPLIPAATSMSVSHEASGKPALAVNLIVNTKFVRKPVQNVIATIFGGKDPDHFVIIGASRNSIEPGGSINGTSLLLKLAAGLSAIFHNDSSPWIPKRTIRFVSWGGTDIGNVGAVEFVEKSEEIYKNKIAVYANLDHPLEMNRKPSIYDPTEPQDLILTASPSLEELIEILADMGKVQQRADNRSLRLVTDRLYHNRQKRMIHTDHPLHLQLGAPYFHLAASLDGLSNNSEILAGLNDVCRLTALVAVSLADAGVFQLRLHQTAHQLITAVNKITSVFASLIPNRTLDEFTTAGNELRTSVTALDSFINNHLAFQHEEDIRMVNSAMLHFESLIARLIGQAKDMLDRYVPSEQSVKAIDVSTIRCDSIPARVRIASDISRLLTKMLAAGKIISLMA